MKYIVLVFSCLLTGCSGWQVTGVVTYATRGASVSIQIR